MVRKCQDFHLEHIRQNGAKRSVEDQKMRVNSVNRVTSLTRPPSQVIFFSKLNIENNFAALLFLILIYILRLSAKIPCNFRKQAVPSIALTTNYSGFSINSRKTKTESNYAANHIEFLTEMHLSADHKTK